MPSGSAAPTRRSPSASSTPDLDPRRHALAELGRASGMPSPTDRSSGRALTHRTSPNEHPGEATTRPWPSWATRAGARGRPSVSARRSRRPGGSGHARRAASSPAQPRRRAAPSPSPARPSGEKQAGGAARERVLATRWRRAGRRVPGGGTRRRAHVVAWPCGSLASCVCGRFLRAGSPAPARRPTTLIVHKTCSAGASRICSPCGSCAREGRPSSSAAISWVEPRRALQLLVEPVSRLTVTRRSSAKRWAHWVQALPARLELRSRRGPGSTSRCSCSPCSPRWRRAR